MSKKARSFAPQEQEEWNRRCAKVQYWQDMCDLFSGVRTVFIIILGIIYLGFVEYAYDNGNRIELAVLIGSAAGLVVSMAVREWTLRKVAKASLEARLPINPKETAAME